MAFVKWKSVATLKDEFPTPNGDDSTLETISSSPSNDFVVNFPPTHITSSIVFIVWTFFSIKSLSASACASILTTYSPFASFIPMFHPAEIKRITSYYVDNSIKLPIKGINKSGESYFFGIRWIKEWESVINEYLQVYKDDIIEHYFLKNIPIERLYVRIEVSDEERYRCDLAGDGNGYFIIFEYKDEKNEKKEEVTNNYFYCNKSVCENERRSILGFGVELAILRCERYMSVDNLYLPAYRAFREDVLKLCFGYTQEKEIGACTTFFDMKELKNRTNAMKRRIEEANKNIDNNLNSLGKRKINQNLKKQKLIFGAMSELLDAHFNYKEGNYEERFDLTIKMMELNENGHGCCNIFV